MSIRDLVDGIQTNASLEDLDKAMEAEVDPTAQDPAPTEVLPDNPADPLKGTKFEGKSAQEIYEAYKNLEQVQGRTANDLGVQRKLTDQLLNLKRMEDLGTNGGKPEPVLPSIDSSALVDDPNATLDKYVSAREQKLLDKLESRLNSLESTLVSGQFLARHPDAEQVANSPEFTEWVNRSTLRQSAANAAAQGDYAIADVLLKEFKAEHKAAPAPKSDDASKVALETTAVVDGSTEAKDTTIYSRRKLMELRLHKPDVYRRPDFQAKVQQAYAEGRVR